MDIETAILVLLVALIAAVAVPWLLSRRNRTDNPAKSGRTKTAENETPKGSPQVRRLPAAQQTPSTREMRRQLKEAAVLLSRDLERARHFSMRNGAVVQADFALGDSRWTMRSTAAGDADTTASLLILSPAPGMIGSWRFLSARRMDGKPGLPNFVFFPDGTAQGGRIAMGWDMVRAAISLTTAGAHRIDYENTETAKP